MRKNNKENQLVPVSDLTEDGAYLRSENAIGIRAAYAVRKLRMFAPFLTQLSCQYDPVETQNKERQNRRARAKASYERKPIFQKTKPTQDIKV